jgi:hypothetical protein
MDEIYQDEWGNYFDAYGRQLSINDLIARGIDVAGAWASRSPYYSPDDPRYREQQGRYPQPSNVYWPQQTVSPTNLNRQGFQLEWWALVGIGAIVGAVFLGKKLR